MSNWLAFMAGAFSMWLVVMVILAVMRFTVIPAMKEEENDDDSMA